MEVIDQFHTPGDSFMGKEFSIPVRCEAWWTPEHTTVAKRSVSNSSGN